MTLFLYLLGNLVVTLGRGELVVAHGVVDALRQILIRVMLAENGVHESDGQKRANPYLTVEQRQVLEALPTPRVSPDEIVGSCRAVTTEFVDRRRLARPIATNTSTATASATIAMGQA